jgi:hypothetical protein
VESSELVRLLLREGGPERLFQFAAAGERYGYDRALREHYLWKSTLHLDELRRQEISTAGLIE